MTTYNTIWQGLPLWLKVLSIFLAIIFLVALVLLIRTYYPNRGCKE